MSKRSVKELFDEVTSLDRIDLKILLEWFEFKLGIPGKRSVRPPAVVDDNVFVSGYDITVTGNISQNRLPVVKKLREDCGFTINESVTFWIVFPKRFMNSIRKMMRLRSGENIWKLD